MIELIVFGTMAVFWSRCVLDVWCWYRKRAQDKKAMAYLRVMIDPRIDPGDAAAEEKLRAQIEKRLQYLASPRSEGFDIGYSVPDPPPPPPPESDPSIRIKEGRW